jgi:arginine exporter protein ArgO
MYAKDAAEEKAAELIYFVSFFSPKIIYDRFLVIGASSRLAYHLVDVFVFYAFLFEPLLYYGAIKSLKARRKLDAKDSRISAPNPSYIY